MAVLQLGNKPPAALAHAHAFDATPGWVTIPLQEDNQQTESMAQRQLMQRVQQIFLIQHYCWLRR